MGRKSDRNDAELQEGDGLVRTTVVGGQPRKRPTIRMSIRVGLERVLYRAAVDKGFRKALLKDRDGALRAAGMELSAGETAVLSSVDRDALATLIDNVRPEARKDHRFVKAVAATFVTLATGTTACDMNTDTVQAGIPTDVPPQTDLNMDYGAIAGIQPDFGPSTDVDVDFGPVKGIVPDDVPAMDLDVSEPGGTHGILPDDTFVTEDVGPPPVGGIMPDVVEAEVAQPMEGGSSADVIAKSTPRKK